MTMKKIKKVLFNGMALSALTLVGVPTTFAEVGNTEGEGNTGAISRSYVTLEGISETDEPTNPIIPGEDGGATGNTGSLRIDWVTPIEFGEVEVSGDAATYESISVRPNVQVSDLRGNGAGWGLFVESSSFANGENMLKGAEITLPAGTVTPAEGGNVSGAPLVREVTINADGVSDAEFLMAAEENTGMGTWANEFDASEITLHVPAGNLAGDYEATLTWTLVDAVN